MRKFRFRLEPVETVRRNKEREVLRQLGAAQVDLQKCLQYREELKAKLADALMRCESLADNGVLPPVIAVERDYISGTKQRIIQADQAIFRARKRVDKVLKSYLDARTKTRTIEVLREKAHAEHKRDLSKREQRELDDLTIMRERFKKEVA